MNIIDEIDSKSSTCKIAHIYRDTVMTYSELHEKSDALASFLIDKFGKDNTPIVVFGHKQNEMIICFLACVKAGHAYVPVDESFPDGRVKDIIEGSCTKLIFGISKIKSGLTNVEILDIDGINKVIKNYLGCIPDKSYLVKPDDTYYILYTSGSTGKPKGVQITLSCIESFIRWGLKLCKLKEGKHYTFMNQVPFSFDVSVMDTYLAFVSGSTSFSIDKEMISNPKELFDYLKKSNIDIWVSTPSFAEMCLADSSFNSALLSHVETFMFCGETLPNTCVQMLKSRFKGARVINTYGPTETTVAVTAVEVDDELNKKSPLPIGRAKDGCMIKIVDSSNKEVPDGQKGEIIIIGDSVGKGYYRNDDMTKKVFFTININGKNEKCYKTGDAGYIKDGMVYYCGRIDFQVKLNGYRIEPEDIENNIRKIDFISNCAVIPVVRNDKVEYLAAFVSLSKKFDEKEFKIGMQIKSELKKNLPVYMIPRKIVIKDKLPMNTNGKVNRKLLLEEIK